MVWAPSVLPMVACSSADLALLYTQNAIFCIALSSLQCILFIRAPPSYLPIIRVRQNFTPCVFSFFFLLKHKNQSFGVILFGLCMAVRPRHLGHSGLCGIECHPGSQNSRTTNLLLCVPQFLWCLPGIY